MDKGKQKPTIGNKSDILFFEGERLITPDIVGHNVSGRPVEGFISPSFGEVEFLGKDEVPEPKVFHVDNIEIVQ